VGAAVTGVVFSTENVSLPLFSSRVERRRRVLVEAAKREGKRWAARCFQTEQRMMMRGWKEKRARGIRPGALLFSSSLYCSQSLTCSIFVSPRLSVELIHCRSSLRPTK
jgi:hypothetical protein